MSSPIERFRLLADNDGPAHALPAGISVLVAGAGSGKTWTLVHLVLRTLLEDPHLDPASILLITFTNAAADELAVRLRSLLVEAAAVAAGTTPGSDAVQRLLHSAGERLGPAAVAERLAQLEAAAESCTVTTIHGWCGRILDVWAHRCGGSPGGGGIVADELLWQEAVADAWRSRVQRDGLLAAALGDGGFDADLAFISSWRPARDTRLLLDLDLPAAGAAAETAVDALQAALSTVPDLVAELDDWAWLADKPLTKVGTRRAACRSLLSAAAVAPGQRTGAQTAPQSEPAPGRSSRLRRLRGRRNGTATTRRRLARLAGPDGRCARCRRAAQPWPTQS
jgi:hypothetical protein